MFLSIMTVGLLLFACTGFPTGTSATPGPGEVNEDLSTAQATLMPSKSAITGQVLSVAAGSPEPLSQTVVRLAKVFWNEEHTDGAYVLDGASSPGAITNDEGRFSIVNIEPADYVIVVGDIEGTHVIISESSGKAKLYTAEVGKVLDVGNLEVSLSQVK